MQKIFFVLLSMSLAANAVPNSAISSATAGSGRASVEAVDSPFLNPATIPYLRGYIFTSSFNSSSEKSSDMTFSITDHMKETVIPTSLGYSQSTFHSDAQGRNDSSQTIRSQDLRLAFGEKTGDRFGAGFSVHHKSDRTDTNSYAQTNLTLASVFVVNDSLSAGLVFDDVLPNSAAVPELLRLKTKTAIAMSYNYKRVIRTKLDLISGGNNSFAKPSLLGGVETFVNRWLILRIGLGRDQEAEANIYSGGVGFQGPRFGVHYAYLQSQQDENFSRHTVDLAIPIW